jgi:hypothetical protein
MSELLLRQGPLQKLLAKQTGRSRQSVDWEAVAQAHIHAVAGACLGMAIRYAGTGNPEVGRVLRAHTMALLEAKRLAPDASGAACSRFFVYIMLAARSECRLRLLKRPVRDTRLNVHT